MAVGATAVVALVGAGYGVRALTDSGSGTSATISASSTGGESNGIQVTGPPPVTGNSDEPVAAVADAVSPSVVQVEVSNGLGSGVIYDSSGLIMTNNHVVTGQSTVNVRLADGTKLSGQVVGTDPSTDIAVVRVSSDKALTAAQLSPNQPRVGQIAVAVGSPFGLTQSVTSGVVSAVNRPVDNEVGVAVNMIQTDAPINPGNSGGALANRQGQVMGINTSIFSQSGENNGIGFAIPIAQAKQVADKILNGGSLARAGLGLAGANDPSGNPGAYVREVTSGGAAAAAGIQNGDLIVSVDGTPVKSFEELRGAIASHSPGDQVTLEIVRDAKTSTVTVTLGTLSSSSSSNGSGGSSQTTPRGGN